jgi:hypothetical protein
MQTSSLDGGTEPRFAGAVQSSISRRCGRLAASLGVMWSTGLPPTDPPLTLSHGEFIFASLACAVLVFSCDSQGVVCFLVRPVHRYRVRQAVEGGGLHQTHTLPGIACYLRCSGMNSRCGCRQNGLLVSLFYFLFSFTAFLLRLVLSIPESYARPSYIPGCFTIPDLMILRHVLYLGGRLI